MDIVFEMPFWSCAVVTAGVQPPNIAAASNGKNNLRPDRRIDFIPFCKLPISFTKLFLKQDSLQSVNKPLIYKGVALIFVSEIFYSLQGEGRYAGRPSVFVRFGGCNLRCEGFGGKCDSYYAADGSFREEWSKYDANTLITEHSKAKRCEYADTVLTGGEPTLWFKDADFMKFAKYLYESGSFVTIETNGTKTVDFGFEPYTDFVYAISLKLSNSGERIEDRLNTEAIEAYIKNSKHFFKFVLSADFIESGDAKAEIDYLKHKFKISPQNIYCMPLGASKEELLKHAKSVFEFCADEGYSYSDRLHIRVFDKKRGV